MRKFCMSVKNHIFKYGKISKRILLSNKSEKYDKKKKPLKIFIVKRGDEISRKNKLNCIFDEIKKNDRSSVKKKNRHGTRR